MEDQVRSLLPSSIPVTTHCTKILAGAANFCFDRQHVDLNMKEMWKGIIHNSTLYIASLQKESLKAAKEYDLTAVFLVARGR